VGQQFWKVLNAGYTHMKPNLCPTCIHCVPANDRIKAQSYTHVCEAKQHILSAISAEKGRCADYAPAQDQRIPQSDVDEEIALLRQYKTRRKARR